MIIEPTRSDDQRELVSFKTGQLACGVDIMAVREIRGWTPATPLPHAPEHVRGVINLRGEVLPILDLGGRLGMGAAEPTDRHAIIVASIKGRMVGLLVDAVSDILTVDKAAIQPAPADGRGAVTFVEGLLPSETGMLSIIALDSLVFDPPVPAAA